MALDRPWNHVPNARLPVVAMKDQFQVMGLCSSRGFLPVELDPIVASGVDQREPNWPWSGVQIGIWMVNVFKSVVLLLKPQPLQVRPILNETHPLKVSGVDPRDPLLGWDAFG